jgi:tripartite-type tricarboxylate transporter receptor subunit TctC
MATRADAPWQNLAQVIAAAREKPGSITYATSGVGTTQHLAAELLAQTVGITLNHVPYRGGTAPLPDVLSGRVDLYMDTITTTGPGIRDGKLRGIGVTSPEAWPLLPEAPPMAATVPGFQVMSWAGLAGPPGLPAPIMQRLNAELHKAMADRDVQARMATLGAIPKVDSPAEFAQLVALLVATWRLVVAKAGIERQ